MGKGDALASGQKSATFAMGGDSKDSPITLRNSKEDSGLESHVDNSALFTKRKPQVVYRGKPLGDMVLVRRVTRESSSMIVLPDSAKGKSDMGIISGVGQGATDITTGKRTPMSVKEGDLVLFDKFAAVGMEVSLLDEHGDEREHLVLREHDVLLILEEVKPSTNGTCLQ